MPPNRSDSGDDGAGRLVNEARAAKREFERSYRGRALKLFPPICTRCGREFSGKRLRELTVHHKDGDHDNNPPDGSNWELLCVFCHEYEHESSVSFAERTDGGAVRDTTPPLTQRPFANIASLLKDRKE